MRWFQLGKKIGLDLGTANTRVFLPDQGIVVREPSVVAIDKTEGQVLAVGNQANEMLGRTPDNIIAIRPMRDGVIADFDIAHEMIRILLRQALGKKGLFFKPHVMVCVPSGITNVEKRAVEDAVMQSGAKDVVLLEEPMLAAIGAGIAVKEPVGHMVIDLGSGTTEIAVLSLGGIVVSRSLRTAGNAMDHAITSFIKREYALAIGERTAEEIKIEIGSVLPYDGEESFEMKGRDTSSGLPKNTVITAGEVRQALTEPVKEIISAIQQTLEETPPELAGDVMEGGILLTGGGARLRNLDQLITSMTGLQTRVAEEAMDCTALGTKDAFLDPHILERSNLQYQ